MPPGRAALTEEFAGKARALGFDLVGFSSAQPPSTADRYQDWLAQGFHGEMAYLGRADAVAKRNDLGLIQAGVRTVVTVGVNYHTLALPPEQRDDPSRGILASYAWGRDYHDLLLPRLRRLGSWIETQVGETVLSRAYVDTGPLLERDLAARSGLGFVGKNTNLIHHRFGSWLFLGELLLTTDLSARAPAPAAGTCGHCTRCLDACPTSALVRPYVLDARRCISYLTIELRGPIPRELRPLVGNRLFGCDICQEVCPWNRRFARATTDPAFQPGPSGMAPRLLDLITLDPTGFRQLFRHSPIMRTKRHGLLRNALVALGNWADPAAIPFLVAALHDPEPLLRGHAAWALGRIPHGQARFALEQASAAESDAWVEDEIRQALVHFLSIGRDVV